jgi:hypothetical protein
VKERGRLEDLDIDGSIIVNEILKIYEEGVSTGSVCLRTGAIGVL